MSDVEDLLWQVLALTLGVVREMDDLEIERGDGASRALVEPLNRIDEHVFFALFAIVPGMYGEDDDQAKARDRRFHERYGDLPDRLGLNGSPNERIEQLLVEARRRIGSVTILLDAGDDADGEFAALDELELALEGVADACRRLTQITRGVE